MTDPEPKPLLQVTGAHCSIDGHPIVQGVSFSLAAGELGCLLGPSGCGKTTLLRAVAGFQPLDAGNIVLRGETVAARNGNVPPERRRIGFVFQDLALFPHLDVSRNVGFGLNRWSRDQRRQRVAEMLDLLGLAGLDARYPHELSGGQQQRVALARALAPRPDLLLLDEPFSSLDAHLRISLRDELKRVLQATGTAALLVTHDQDEAFGFAQSIGVMRAGRLLQWSDSFELYHRPASPFIARFVGEGRLLPARIVDAGSIDTPLGRLLGPVPEALLGRDAWVLVRPDDLLPDGTDGVPAEVIDAAFRGAETLYTLRLGDGSDVCALFPSHRRLAVGSHTRVRTDLAHLVLFDSFED